MEPVQSEHYQEKVCTHPKFLICLRMAKTSPKMVIPSSFNSVLVSWLADFSVSLFLTKIAAYSSKSSVGIPASARKALHPDSSRNRSTIIKMNPFGRSSKYIEGKG